jgi:MFS family permease
MEAAAPRAGEPEGSQRLALLLAMAMFVLVVDTSLMNVSISAVVRDLDTTVSGVQSAIALEALVSAAFILIGSKVGDLYGRKRAYVLGLLGYAVGAAAMTLAQDLTAIVVFWAIVGGIGAALLLPAMQSLIHGNFTGSAQRKVYALVGAAAAIAAAVGPLLGGFITTYLSWRVAFGLEVVVIAIVLSGITLVDDVPYTGSRAVDPVGAILSVVGMGGIVLGILVWQEGGESVAALLAAGAMAMGALVYWLRRRAREGKARLLDPGLFESRVFRFGITGQLLQQIALGGMMIALPIYLQMVLEYSAMEAGLSLAPLSLTMFATALVVGKKAGDRRPSRVPAAQRGSRRAPADRAASRQRLGARGAAYRRGLWPGTARVPAQQLHAQPGLRGAHQRGGWRELGRRIVWAVVRSRVRRSDHARDPLHHLHRHGGVE